MRNILYLMELQENGILTEEEYKSAVYSYIFSMGYDNLHLNMMVVIASSIILEVIRKI